MVEGVGVGVGGQNSPRRPGRISPRKKFFCAVSEGTPRLPWVKRSRLMHKKRTLLSAFVNPGAGDPDASGRRSC